MAEPRLIAGIIKKEQKRLWKSCPGLGLQSLWEQAAGPEIAANASVKSFRNGVMTVSCSSGAWACELRLHGDVLKEKINGLKPPEEIHQIRFVQAGGIGGKSRK